MSSVLRESSFELWSWRTIAAIVAAAGCTDTAASSTPDDASVAESGVEVDGCSGRDDGKRCGSGMHCFSQRCVEDECGDGIVSAGESCDDGNNEWADGCDSECQLEREGCPDGMVAPDEECDDGNWLNDDRCSNACLIINVCGNDRVELDEECDDGNVVDDDDCSNECLHLGCRNGRIEGEEECDDGNTVDRGDGCTNACKLSVCGNGKLEKYETCDDGNQMDGDRCPSNCSLPTVCGNGVIEPEGGEVCEQGHAEVVAEGGKGKLRSCSSDCKRWDDTEANACVKCQNERCTDWMGLNLVKGCFEAANPDFVPPGSSADYPDFIPDCISAVNCSFARTCGFTDPYQATECYCGANVGDPCTTMGPAPTAPCLTEWMRAARTSVNADVLNRFTDTGYPAGWAYFLIQCYATECAEVCVPEATHTGQ